MANRPNSSGSPSLGDWLLPIIFLFALPPVGVLLIAVKLFGTPGSKKTAYSRRSFAAQPTPSGARTSTSEFSNSPKRQPYVAPLDPTADMAKTGKTLSLVGMICTLLFGFCTVISVTDSLWMLPDVLWFLEENIAGACFTAGGAITWLAGRRTKKKVRRYRQYLAMIGKNQVITLSSLASATGRSVAQVQEDLQDMLDDGMFPTGFLDYGGGQLILSPEGLNQTPKQPAKTKEQAQEADENAILVEIKAINDAINDPELSAQIDRIGVITAKIFDYRKSHPEKSSQLHGFLSYYLPTTLKILRAYAQLESQDVAGENISAAMERIEGMMDKVVEGFEKQLDQLFQKDALDITSDVKVLEQMLAKDGLSSKEGIQLTI